MARKGENIYLRKDGRWEGRYIQGRRPDGKPIFRSVYGKQYCEVKKRLILLKSSVYLKEEETALLWNVSFYEWSEYWLEELTRPYIRQSTYMGYRRNLEKHIYPILGTVYLQELRPEKIQTMVRLLQPKMAGSTLQGICRLLKSILASAQKKGVLYRNPYYNIKLPRIRQRPPRVLSKKEQIRMERHLLETGELQYILCLYTGLRVGELCALRWQDVDFENNSLHVRHSVKRIQESSGGRKSHLILEAPKSEYSVREIPLPQFLTAMLRDKLLRENRKPEQFLFPGSKSPYPDPRTVQQGLSKICHLLQLSDVHMHTLRHTFATRCLERGISYEVLCEFLGHSSPQITLRHYVHCTPEQKRASMDRLGTILSEE